MALRGLITPELLVEWERRLDDFERKGWRNHVEPVGPPKVEYVGILRRERGEQDLDRVVVRIEAKLRDYVVDSQRPPHQARRARSRSRCGCASTGRSSAAAITGCWPRSNQAPRVSMR